ncbi:MAG: hypothetical protein AB4050_18830 [Synechococcus sp.]
MQRTLTSNLAVLGLSAFATLVGVMLPATQSISQTGISRLNYVYSADNGSRVNVPGRWLEQGDLNGEADLQVADLRSEEYLIVISEPKVDFPSNWTFRNHADVTRQLLLDNLGTAASVSSPSQLTINGRQAIQYEIRTEIQGLRVVYLHTTVDGENTYHQLLAWTLADFYPRNQTVLKSAISSFEEVR